MTEILTRCCRIDEVNTQIDFLAQNCKRIAQAEESVDFIAVEGMGRLLSKIRDELKEIVEEMDQ